MLNCRKFSQIKSEILASHCNKIEDEEEATYKSIK